MLSCSVKKFDQIRIRSGAETKLWEVGASTGWPNDWATYSDTHAAFTKE